MQAAWFEKQGPAADVFNIGQQPTPEPSQGQARVRLYASAVNPSDVKKRAGLQPAPIDQGPVIPHSDGAGIIDAVGSGVAESRIGERVWVYQAQYQRRLGTAAEYVTLPIERVVTLPDDVDFAVGACMGIPAMTAHRCVFADGDVSGQNILVTGAAGRVGYYAVQWAKAAGARVIATIGREQCIEDVGEAGADSIINYREDNLLEAISDFTGGVGVNRVIDVEFGTNLPTTLQIIASGGVIATYSSSQMPEPKLPFYPLMFKDISIRLVLVYAMPEAAKQQAAADIITRLQEGKLKHRISKRYALIDIAKAHETIEAGGVRGCVVVDTP